MDCKELTSISIPPSVTKIGNWAFSDCSSLTEVRIPAGGLCEYDVNLYGDLPF